MLGHLRVQQLRCRRERFPLVGQRRGISLDPCLDSREFVGDRLGGGPPAESRLATLAAGSSADSTSSRLTCVERGSPVTFRVASSTFAAAAADESSSETVSAAVATIS